MPATTTPGLPCTAIRLRTALPDRSQTAIRLRIAAGCDDAALGRAWSTGSSPAGFPKPPADPARRRAWFEGYVRTLTERVVMEIAQIERAAEIPRLVQLCAARTATELNVTSLAADLGISARMVGSYLAHLETTFLIRLVPAWSTNLSAKVVRRPKLLMTDAALAAHLTETGPERLGQLDGPIGSLLETLVGTELGRQLSWSQAGTSLWHFRDRGGTEVDFVLEHPDGRIVALR